MEIGKINSVNYESFKVSVFPSIKGSSVNIKGTVYYFGNIGGYLKTTNSLGETLVCEVVAIFDSDKYNDQKAFDVEGKKELLMKPIGTLSRKNEFSLGVGVYPSIYTDVEILTYQDMEAVLGVENTEESKNGVHEKFYLGESKSLINYPISVSIDKFFNIHSAVLGNSGSGKSNTVSHILQDILKKEENSAIGSRIIVFDVNGEYSNSFKSGVHSSKVFVKHFKPSTGLDGQEDPAFEPFQVPHFLMTLDEWCSFLLATDATQRPFWEKVLQECYRFYSLANRDPGLSFKMVNYLKVKICQILNNLLEQAESDTVKITAASSVISRIYRVIESNEDILRNCQGHGFYDEINELRRCCGINYGENKGQLSNAVTRMLASADTDAYFEVLGNRMTEGEYFDSNFLRVACDLVLLEEDSRGNGRVREYTSTMITRLEYFLENPECSFMREGRVPLRSIEEYLKYFWRGLAEGASSQVVVIDVSELSPDALEVLTSVVTRLIFSERKKLKNQERREKPVHVVLDEAHRYIKKDSNYYLRENIFEKIAREGRKFSFYLLVSSQRPSELSDTVLSQCGNFIVHRIQNEVDMRYIYSVLPFFSDDLSGKVKQSAPGEALIFGNCVPLPIHVKVSKADPEPDSKNCHIPTEWFKNIVTKESLTKGGMESL